MSKKKQTHKQTAHQPQPRWQPIEMLATFAQHIDGMLASSQEQYETLLPARSKPHVLDNFTIDRVINAFTTQIGDLWLFDTQLQRWATEQITASQRAEVERLQGQMKTLRETDEQVLALARELSQGTIEKVLGKSDEQLGLEMLMRMMEG
jgi:hypothetical protein